MTLSIAWVRTKTRSPELVFCSDSRLRFGCAWDACQKTFPLPRGDCAISFAGETQYAFPFVHAAVNAVSLHRGSQRRSVDLTEVAPVLLNAMNGMLDDIGDQVKGRETVDEPDLRLAFGGYSWRKKNFLLWKFRFNPGRRKFEGAKVGAWKGLGKGRRLVVLGHPEASRSAIRRARRTGTGDPDTEDDVQELAIRRLVELLKRRGLEGGQGLDMEPFEILCDLLREERSPHVGGPPQLVKVYQHLNAQPFGVMWPNRESGRVAVLGRRLPRGEKAHVPIIDPKTCQVVRAKEESWKNCE